VKSPAFQFYPADFLGGTVATYSLDEIGLYTVLLAFDWSLNGLPTEPEKLAKLARISTRKFAVLWKTVGENFSQSMTGVTSTPAWSWSVPSKPQTARRRSMLRIADGMHMQMHLHCKRNALHLQLHLLLHLQYRLLMI
jgi:hypothetical protein